MRYRAFIAALVATIVLLVSCASASAAPILWGAWVDGDAYGPAFDDPPWDMAAQDVFEQHAGKRATLIHYGQAWKQGSAFQPFYPNDAQRVADRGAVPLLDWNPWDLWAGGGPNQPAFRLSKIANGSFDSYIRSWALGVKAWGKRIMVRPMHEMNGKWYPWSERANGNRAGDYVKAWRRIVSVADKAGASNIEWVWCVNAVYPGSIPIGGLYPGAAYVDWVGLDAYNFGAPWTPLYTLVKPTYDQLRKLAPTKPVILAETGSSEAGGSKAAWITDALGDLAAPDFPAIAAVAWFNWNDGGDWSIETSPAAQEAFRAGIADPAYVAAP